MITHLSHTRGMADFGWLKSRHSFSFGEYYNPSRMGFGALRVINDDAVSGSTGFGNHPHEDMEIISIPLEGALKHRDSEGNAHEIKKGEVQIMSAGTGIYHSEYNASIFEEVKFLQIWVMPKKLGIKPRYEQKAFPESNNKLTVVVSPDGKDGGVTINQDAWFSLGKFDEGQSFEYDLKRKGNGVYLFILSGSVEVDGQKLSVRDGAGFTDVEKLNFKVIEKGEFLLIDVPMNTQE